MDSPEGSRGIFFCSKYPTACSFSAFVLLLFFCKNLKALLRVRIETVINLKQFQGCLKVFDSYLRFYAGIIR